MDTPIPDLTWLKPHSLPHRAPVERQTRATNPTSDSPTSKYASNTLICSLERYPISASSTFKARTLRSGFSPLHFPARSNSLNKARRNASSLLVVFAQTGRCRVPVAFGLSVLTFRPHLPSRRPARYSVNNSAEKLQT